MDLRSPAASPSMSASRVSVAVGKGLDHAHQHNHRRRSASVSRENGAVPAQFERQPGLAGQFVDVKRDRRAFIDPQRRRADRRAAERRLPERIGAHDGDSGLEQALAQVIRFRMRLEQRAADGVDGRALMLDVGAERSSDRLDRAIQRACLRDPAPHRDHAGDRADDMARGGIPPVDGHADRQVIAIVAAAERNRKEGCQGAVQRRSQPPARLFEPLQRRPVERDGGQVVAAAFCVGRRRQDAGQQRLRWRGQAIQPIGEILVVARRFPVDGVGVDERGIGRARRQRLRLVPVVAGLARQGAIGEQPFPLRQRQRDAIRHDMVADQLHAPPGRRQLDQVDLEQGLIAKGEAFGLDRRKPLIGGALGIGGAGHVSQPERDLAGGLDPLPRLDGVHAHPQGFMPPHHQPDGLPREIGIDRSREAGDRADLVGGRVADQPRVEPDGALRMAERQGCLLAGLFGAFRGHDPFAVAGCAVVPRTGARARRRARRRRRRRLVSAMAVTRPCNPACIQNARAAARSTVSAMVAI